MRKVVVKGKKHPKNNEIENFQRDSNLESQRHISQMTSRLSHRGKKKKDYKFQKRSNDLNIFVTVF